MKIAFGHDMHFETSRRVISAHGGVVGIGPHADYATGGWDDGFGGPGDFTDAERIELADYMIGLWQRFKEQQ